MDTSHLLYASDLTDAEWPLLEPLLPPCCPPAAPRVSHRSPPSALLADHPQCHLLRVAHRRGLAVSAAGVATVEDGVALREKVAAGWDVGAPAHGVA